MIMEILQFVFQDIWHFIGVFILIGIISNAFKGSIIINKKGHNKKEKND